MRIAVLAPWTDPTGDFVKVFRGLLENEVDMTGIEIVAIDSQAEPVVYRADMPPAASGLDSMPFCIPEVMKKAKALEKDGFDAIVNACILGPGSPQAAQIVDIPVLDPGEVAMHVASMLGHKFSLLVPGKSAVRGFQENVKKYCMEDKIASILLTDISPASYTTKEKETMQVILDLSQKTIEEDDAAVIVLGCGMLTGKGKKLQQLLKEAGHDVTVLQPVPLAIEFAKVLVTLHLKRVRLVPEQYTHRF
jgi:allantoin racemase